MNVPLLDLKAQYASLSAPTPPSEVIDSQHFILGPAVRGSRRRSRPTAGAATPGRLERHRRALVRAHGARDRPGRRGDHDPVHVLRHRRLHRARRRAPGVRRHRPATFNIDPGAIEAASPAKTKAIMPVHLFGQMRRHGRDHGRGRRARPPGDRGRRPGDRRHLAGPRGGLDRRLRLLQLLPVEEPRRARATAA